MSTENVSTWPRVTLRIPPDEYERAKYWASKHDLSVNEYVREALMAAIRHENQDYVNETRDIFIATMNQLSDIVKMTYVETLHNGNITTMGFDSLLSLTRGHTSGDNYLIDRDPEDDF